MIETTGSGSDPNVIGSIYHSGLSMFNCINCVFRDNSFGKFITMRQSGNLDKFIFTITNGGFYSTTIKSDFFNDGSSAGFTRDITFSSVYFTDFYSVNLASGLILME